MTLFMNAYAIKTMIYRVERKNGIEELREDILVVNLFIQNLKCMAKIIQFHDIGQKVMISSNQFDQFNRFGAIVIRKICGY